MNSFRGRVSQQDSLDDRANPISVAYLIMRPPVRLRLKLRSNISRDSQKDGREGLCGATVFCDAMSTLQAYSLRHGGRPRSKLTQHQWQYAGQSCPGSANVWRNLTPRLQAPGFFLHDEHNVRRGQYRRVQRNLYRRQPRPPYHLPP
jgi:hypothetical protein